MGESLPSASPDTFLIGCLVFFLPTILQICKIRSEAASAVNTRLWGRCSAAAFVFFFFFLCCKNPTKLCELAPGVWRRSARASLGRVRRHLLLQNLGKAVVEEEELAVGKHAAEQSVQAVALQQDLEGKGSLTQANAAYSVTSSHEGAATALTSVPFCCPPGIFVLICADLIPEPFSW